MQVKEIKGFPLLITGKVVHPLGNMGAGLFDITDIRRTVVGMNELSFKLDLLCLLLNYISLTGLILSFSPIRVKFPLFVKFHNPCLIGLVFSNESFGSFQKRQDMTILLTGLFIDGR